MKEISDYIIKYYKNAKCFGVSAKDMANIWNDEYNKIDKDFNIKDMQNSEVYKKYTIEKHKQCYENSMKQLKDYVLKQGDYKCR